MTVIIKEINIYGYGKFEHFRLTDIGSLQVIYGKNEAGKSTIMSFIHSILFGFPTRQQNELRYEPKSHAKYGGQLVLYDAKLGEVTIERVKGKAAGDVTVTFADGTRGGEELLSQFLRGIDKGTYQAIYSFNIHSLQNVHKLKGEDLNRYLFSASAVGSDRLLEAENLFIKEQEKRFRPYGRKPVLNRHLDRLQDLSRKLTAARQDNDRYEDLLRDLERTERDIEALREEVEHINRSLQEKRDWNRAFPFVKEKRELEKELDAIGNPPFPRNGVRRFEQLEGERVAIVERLNRRIQDAEQLQEEMAAIQVREDILAKEDDIIRVIESLPTYQQEEEQAGQIEMQLAGVEQDLSRLFDRLGYRLDEDELLSLNLGFAVKDRILQIEKERDHLLRQKEQLEKEERDVQTRLEQAEKFLQELRARRLAVEEKEKLEKIITASEETERIELEWQWVDARWQELQAKSTTKTKPVLPVLMLVLLFLLTALYIVFTNSRELIIPAVIFFLVVTFSFLFLRKSNDMFQELEMELAKRRQELAEKRKHQKGLLDQVRSAREKLEADRQLAQKLEIEKIQFRQLDRQFTALVDSFANWEKAYNDVEQQINALGRSLALPADLAQRHLLTSYELLVAIKEKVLEKKKLIAELARIHQSLQEKEQSLYELQIPLVQSGGDFHEQVQTLQAVLVSEQNKRKELLARQQKYEEILAEVQAYREDEEILAAQLQQLLQEAQVTTKEAYYRQAEKVSRREEILERMKLLDEQLSRIPIKIPSGASLRPVDESIFQQLEQEKEKLATHIEKLERKRASILHAIQQIEEGGTYTELLHAYYQEKHRFNELAKEWAVYRVSAYILAKSTEIYKEERLPLLLQRAASLFQTITGNEYETIMLDPDQDEFYVKRADGMMFSPQELSQATQEQLYISIRLALTLTMNERVRLPILIDDGFVNFDEKRLQQMIQVIKQTDQQIILFTCHRRIAEQFAGETVFFLPE